jgi:hypothetical protein
MMVQRRQYGGIDDAGQDGVDPASRTKRSLAIVNPLPNLVAREDAPAVEAAARRRGSDSIAVPHRQLGNRLGFDFIHKVHHMVTITPVVPLTTAVIPPPLYSTVPSVVPTSGSAASAVSRTAGVTPRSRMRCHVWGESVGTAPQVSKYDGTPDDCAVRVNEPFTRLPDGCYKLMDSGPPNSRLPNTGRRLGVTGEPASQPGEPFHQRSAFACRHQPRHGSGSVSRRGDRTAEHCRKPCG